MIDNRKKLNYGYTTKDDRLEVLSDTEIVLEFPNLLSSVYPHLIKVYAHCYDPFDEIAESLFYSFVYKTFESKYGIPVNYSETHRYAFDLHCFQRINHIQVKPKNYPFTLIHSSGETLICEKSEFQGKAIVFIQFGDTVNNLTGGEEYVDIQTVNFNFTEIKIVDIKTGLPFRSQDNYWISNTEVEYELVLEDYDQEEHQFFKPNQFAN